MRSIAYDGVSAITTDEVAEALMAFALTVARYSSYETATIPVVVHGQVERLTLMLGPTIHLSTLTVPTGEEPVLADGAAAAARLRERAAALAEPPRHLGLAAVGER